MAAPEGLDLYENLLIPSTQDRPQQQTGLNQQRYVKINYSVPAQCGQNPTVTKKTPDGGCSYENLPLPGLVTDQDVTEAGGVGVFSNQYFKITTFSQPQLNKGDIPNDSTDPLKRNVPWPFDIRKHWNFQTGKLISNPLDLNGAVPTIVGRKPDPKLGYYKDTEWSIHSTIVDQIRRGTPQNQFVFDNQGNIIICPLGTALGVNCLSVSSNGGMQNPLAGAGGPTPANQLNPEYDPTTKTGYNGGPYCFGAPIYINPTAGNNSGVGPKNVPTDGYYSVGTIDIFNPDLRPNNKQVGNPNKTNPNGKWIASLENKYWLYNDAIPTKDTTPNPTQQLNLNLYNGSYYLLYNPVHRSHFRDYYAAQTDFQFGQNATTNRLLGNYCYGSVNLGTKDQWNSDAFDTTVWTGPFGPLNINTKPNTGTLPLNVTSTSSQYYSGGTSPTVVIDPNLTPTTSSNLKGNDYFADHLCNYISPPNPSCPIPNEVPCGTGNINPDYITNFMNPFLASYFSGDNAATWNSSKVLSKTLIKGLMGGNKEGDVNPMACFQTDFSNPPSYSSGAKAAKIYQSDSFIAGKPGTNIGTFGDGLYDNGYIGRLSGGSGSCSKGSTVINICQTIVKSGEGGQVTNNEIINKCGNSGGPGGKIPCNELKPAFRNNCAPSPEPPTPKPSPTPGPTPSPTPPPVPEGKPCNPDKQDDPTVWPCAKGLYCDSSESGLSICRMLCPHGNECPAGQNCKQPPGQCVPNAKVGSYSIWCETTGSELGGDDPFTFTGNAVQQQNTGGVDPCTNNDGSRGACLTYVPSPGVKPYNTTTWAQQNCTGAMGAGMKVGWYSCNCGDPNDKIMQPTCIYQPPFSGEEPAFPPGATSGSEMLSTKYLLKSECESSGLCAFDASGGGTGSCKIPGSSSHPEKKKFPIIPVVAGSVGILTLLVLIFIFFL